MQKTNQPKNNTNKGLQDKQIFPNLLTGKFQFKIFSTYIQWESNQI